MSHEKELESIIAMRCDRNWYGEVHVHVFCIRLNNNGIREYRQLHVSGIYLSILINPVVHVLSLSLLLSFLQLLLLGDGSSINAADHHGNTPLHLACSNGHEECVKALLFHKRQCNINQTNRQGDTALHNAARWGYGKSVDMIM